MQSGVFRLYWLIYYRPKLLDLGLLFRDPLRIGIIPLLFKVGPLLYRVYNNSGDIGRSITGHSIVFVELSPASITAGPKERVVSIGDL
jgi:hypothetical protein